MRPSLTAVVPALNEERHLRRCLESVAWAEEILVLDGGSTDQTAQIASSFNARLIAQPLDLVEKHLGNFDIVRNVGFELAAGDWILSLDADEVVPVELADEIRQVTTKGDPRPYFIPRRNLYWGRPVRLLGDDYQLRLFPKGMVHYSGIDLDARPIAATEPGHLKNILVHHSVEGLRTCLEKLQSRTAQRARVRFVQKVPLYPWQPATAFLNAFWRYYIKGSAWKDGGTGLLVAVLYALDPCLTVLKHFCLRARGSAPKRAGPRIAVQK